MKEQDTDPHYILCLNMQSRIQHFATAPATTKLERMRNLTLPNHACMKEAPIVADPDPTMGLHRKISSQNVSPSETWMHEDLF